APHGRQNHQAPRAPGANARRKVAIAQWAIATPRPLSPKVHQGDGHLERPEALGAPHQLDGPLGHP
ncbi:MAG: hypothetical protein VW599_10785, partial [Pseudomonadales bacterium]